MSGETGGEHPETGMTALFVRRPVLAFVLNTLIAVAGLTAFYGVEVRELPDVDRPVITVSANYAGAAAETVDREMTAVLEGAVSRVSGVKSISSGANPIAVPCSDIQLVSCSLRRMNKAKLGRRTSTVHHVRT